MKLNRRTPENIARAAQMRAEGITLREIGLEFGVNESVIRQWLMSPEKYAELKLRAAAWNRFHPGATVESRKKRREAMTREERDANNARQRARYASDPKYRETMRRLQLKHGRTAQGLLAHKVRIAALGFSDRQVNMFEAFMQAVTGMTRDEFTKMFNHEGTFDHIVPLCAFDLTNPEHLVRCCYVANVRLIPRKENELKGSKGRDVDVMALPWVGTEDALVQARTFIGRQLARLDKLGTYRRPTEEEISECSTENVPHGTL